MLMMADTWCVAGRSAWSCRVLKMEPYDTMSAKQQEPTARCLSDRSAWSRDFAAASWGRGSYLSGLAAVNSHALSPRVYNVPALLRYCHASVAVSLQSPGLEEEAPAGRRQGFEHL